MRRLEIIFTIIIIAGISTIIGSNHESMIFSLCVLLLYRQAVILSKLDTMDKNIQWQEHCKKFDEDIRR